MSETRCGRAGGLRAYHGLEILDDAPDPLTVLEHSAKLGPDAIRIVEIRLEEHLEPAEHDRQGIVDLVAHDGRQVPEKSEAPRVLEFLFEQAPPGEISEHEQRLRRQARKRRGGQGNLHTNGQQDGALDDPLEAPTDHVLGRLGVARIQDGLERGADEFLDLLAHGPRRQLVGRQDPALVVHRDQNVGAVVEQSTQPGLRGPQCAGADGHRVFERRHGLVHRKLVGLQGTLDALIALDEHLDGLSSGLELVAHAGHACPAFGFVNAHRATRGARP